MANPRKEFFGKLSKLMEEYGVSLSVAADQRKPPFNPPYCYFDADFHDYEGVPAEATWRVEFDTSSTCYSAYDMEMISISEDDEL